MEQGEEEKRCLIDAVPPLWDSWSEKKAFQYLCEMINVEHFYVFPHLPISEVFKEYWEYADLQEIYRKYCQLCNTESGETHFELFHFDFAANSEKNCFCARCTAD